MAAEYTIEYQAENTYEQPLRSADWQFLIIPEENPNQANVRVFFENSANARWELSRNSFDFNVIRVRSLGGFNRITFHATFHLYRKPVNPFGFDLGQLRGLPTGREERLAFRIRHDRYLKTTPLTGLPGEVPVYRFTDGHSILENLLGLNEWVFKTLKYVEGTTHVDTPLHEVLDHRMGVCQDFTHLFLGVARQHGVPARYVSGYLDQGHGYFGDSRMHAWAEAFLPGIGWTGFDPTNNMLATTDHIKVSHGRDYRDCAPLKGVFTGAGHNATSHQVLVASQQ